MCTIHKWGRLIGKGQEMLLQKIEDTVVMAAK